MGDYFFQLLPPGHAIRTMTLAAARASLGNEPIFGDAVSATVADARNQCAAISWTLDASYSTAAVIALPAAARVYLLKLFGLPTSPNSKPTQAARIDAHRTAHHPPQVGNVGAGAYGGAGNANAAAGAHGGVGAGAHGGAGASLGDDTGGFAPTLLPSDQVKALLAVPRAELRKLLDAAGLPYTPATIDTDLRIKCAAAAWAAEKLRSITDVRMLDDGLRDRMLNAFAVPAAWKSDARQQALVTLLHACRDCSWAVDPSLSLGLVNRGRSELFRLGERAAAAHSDAGAMPGNLLTSVELDELRASLAAGGFSDKDLVFNNGTWSLASGAQPRPATVAGAGQSDTITKIEAELRTLYVNPYSLLTAVERKDQATRAKALPAKRKAAFPGDTETDTADVGLNPFAEWPWEQQLRLTPDMPYSRAGKLLRNMLRFCNKHCTRPVMMMTHENRTTVADNLFDQFMEAVTSGAHDRALLVASQAVAEATEQMKMVLANAQLRATTYPTSAMMVHIAKQRAMQADELRIFLADINTRITEASRAKNAATTSATASWIDFLSGWLSKVDTELVAQETLDQAARTAHFVAPPVTGLSLRSASFNGGTPGGASAASCGSGTGPGAGQGGGTGAGGGRGGRSNGGSGGSSTNATPISGSATPVAKPPWKLVRFKRHIPCSPDVVGDALGVPGAPPCTKCNNGSHFHGECPWAWGNSGTSLPGFGADGSRIPGDWSKTDNEPIRRVVKAWVTFLQDHSNFQGKAPDVAGVAGAPDISDFQKRESTAPRRP